MKCNNCGTEVIKTDLVGDKCVHCYNTVEPKQTDLMECWMCHTTANVLFNGLCKDCRPKFNSMDNDQRTEALKQSWSYK